MPVTIDKIQSDLNNKQLQIDDALELIESMPDKSAVAGVVDTNGMNLLGYFSQFGSANDVSTLLSKLGKHAVDLIFDGAAPTPLQFVTQLTEEPRRSKLIKLFRDVVLKDGSLAQIEQFIKHLSGDDLSAAFESSENPEEKIRNLVIKHPKLAWTLVLAIKQRLPHFVEQCGDAIEELFYMYPKPYANIHINDYQYYVAALYEVDRLGKIFFSKRTPNHSAWILRIALRANIGFVSYRYFYSFSKGEMLDSIRLNRDYLQLAIRSNDAKLVEKIVITMLDEHFRYSLYLNDYGTRVDEDDRLSGFTPKNGLHPLVAACTLKDTKILRILLERADEAKMPLFDTTPLDSYTLEWGLLTDTDNRLKKPGVMYHEIALEMLYYAALNSTEHLQLLIDYMDDEQLISSIKTSRNPTREKYREFEFDFWRFTEMPHKTGSNALHLISKKSANPRAIAILLSRLSNNPPVLLETLMKTNNDGETVLDIASKHYSNSCNLAILSQHCLLKSCVEKAVLDYILGAGNPLKASAGIFGNNKKAREEVLEKRLPGLSFTTTSAGKVGIQFNVATFLQKTNCASIFEAWETILSGPGNENKSSFKQLLIKQLPVKKMGNGTVAWWRKYFTSRRPAADAIIKSIAVTREKPPVAEPKQEPSAVVEPADSSERSSSSVSTYNAEDLENIADAMIAPNEPTTENPAISNDEYLVWPSAPTEPPTTTSPQASKPKQQTIESESDADKQGPQPA